jgi:hypothetical protein
MNSNSSVIVMKAGLVSRVWHSGGGHKNMTAQPLLMIVVDTCDGMGQTQTLYIKAWTTGSVSLGSAIKKCRHTH